MNKNKLPPFPHESLDIVQGILIEAKGRYLTEEMTAFRTSANLLNQLRVSPHRSQDIRPRLDYAAGASNVAGTGRIQITEFLDWLERMAVAAQS